MKLEKNDYTDSIVSKEIDIVCKLPWLISIYRRNEFEKFYKE